MNEIEESKGKYRQAVERLARLDPVLAQAFPDLGSICIPASDLKAQSERQPETVSNRAARRRQERQGRKQLRGFGTVYQPAWHDKKSGERKESPVWWIRYPRKGKIIRESSHSTKESDARKLLKKRLGEIEAGRPVGPAVEKTTFEDIASMITNDYKANGRRSLARVEDALNHLRVFFGDSRAVEITGDRVTAYVTQRQDEDKAAASTINNELAALSRMFVLGMRAGKVAIKPYIGKLKLNNPEKASLNGSNSVPFDATATGPASPDRSGLYHRLENPRRDIHPTKGSC